MGLDPALRKFQAEGLYHGGTFLRGGADHPSYIKNLEVIAFDDCGGLLGGGLVGARTHTVLPLSGRDYVVVTNEGERFHTFDPEEL